LGVALPSSGSGSAKGVAGKLLEAKDCTSVVQVGNPEQKWALMGSKEIGESTRQLHQRMLKIKRIPSRGRQAS